MDVEAIPTAAHQAAEKAHMEPRSLAGTAKQLFTTVGQAVIPSWLLPGQKKALASQKVRRTAYIDGVRGLVSILVFVRHFSLPWYPHLDYGYGYQGYNGFLRLPPFRLLFSGPSVPIFFIVSGYVLSAKSLKLSRKLDREGLLLSFSSTVFRRPLRLFFTPIISTFLVMLLAEAGYFSFPYTDMPGRQPVHPTRHDSIVTQTSRWLAFVTSELINPWQWDIPRLEYGPHLWTLPVSFKGSIVVFMATVAIIRIKTTLRIPFLVASIGYAVSQRRWDMALFLAGMVLCERDLQKDGSALRLLSDPEPSTAGLWRILKVVRLLAGLYIGSFPRYNHHGVCSTGYQIFCNITPNYRYWHGLGAFLILESIDGEKDWQWMLNNSVSQYLGKISFAVYIVHEPLLHLFGFFTVPFFRSVTGTGSTVQSQAGVFLGLAVTGVVLVWIGDLFHRHVEVPCGRLANWLEHKFFAAL
jgi:peptidoglycan/LPS O-acetylase OafA/YrhL